jgi:lysophospholipase L1-like esterase
MTEHPRFIRRIPMRTLLLLTPLFRPLALWLSLATIALVATESRAELPFTDGQRVLFLGDSITQSGQYVALTEAYLWAAEPQKRLDVVSAGLSSETVSGITEPIHPFPRPNVHERLIRALDLVRPDWVVVCYGMNDGIYHPASPEITEAYRGGLEKLITEVSARGAKLILLTPPSFDIDAPPFRSRLNEIKTDEPYGYLNPYKMYDDTLVTLGDIVKSFGDSPGVDRVVDIHQATDSYLKRVKAAIPDYGYGDGIHPPIDGHLAMAVGLLAGLGCDADEVESTLNRLTGLNPADRPADPTDEQRAFLKRLLDRFSARSAAYRKTIGFTAPMTVDALSLDEAQRVASDQERSLRTLISVRRDRLRPEALHTYVETANDRWADEIAELEKLDQTESYSDDAILFVGSSSIRMWENIAGDMAPYAAIRRGYGGAKYSDLAVFADRLITPHHYAAMVVFVGNDVTGSDDDLSIDQIERLARHVIAVSRSHQSDAPILLVEVTPTAARRAAWPEIRKVNDRLREIALTTPNTYFVATADYYLDADGFPIEKYFIDDRLHQNERGYAVWSTLIKRRLGEALATDSRGPLIPIERMPQTTD